MAELPRDRPQVEILVGRQAVQVLDVHQPDDFVQGSLAQGKACVARRASKLEAFRGWLLDVQEHHVATGHHDLSSERVVEAEHGAEELQLGGRQLAGLPA